MKTTYATADTREGGRSPSRGAVTRRCWAAALALVLAVGAGIAAPFVEPSGATVSVGLLGRQTDMVKQAPAAQIDTAPVEAGVVRINTTLSLQRAKAVGTGVVLTPDGQVLTNNHVVEGGTAISATEIRTGRTFPVDVLGYDRTNDIALVQLRGATGLSPVPLGDSNALAVGDSIVGLGNAGGGGAGLSRETGTISGLDQSVTAGDDLTGGAEQLSGLIGLAAPLRPGDSGGPLINRAGQVIGIDTAGTENYKMAVVGGFAIPINRALGIADQIRSGAGSDTVHVGPSALLGVGVNNAADSAGAAVTQVLRGSPADRAGLAGGDVITGVDGTAVADATALTRALDQRHPGDTVTVGFNDRGGNPRTATVTLVTGPTG